MVGRRRARRSGAIRLRWHLFRIENGLVVAELVVELVVGRKVRIAGLHSGADFRNPHLLLVVAVASVVVGKK